MGVKILLAYFGCKQLAFNNNSSFYVNKKQLAEFYKKNYEPMTEIDDSKISQTNNVNKKEPSSDIFGKGDSDDEKSLDG
jgi:uncharacterized membrane protein YqiK